ncbi:MAG: hypothetical protein J2O44_07685 [Porphyrobacter sp.]|nr:hypothetical protein [Porphyrobacter sp.]
MNRILLGALAALVLVGIGLFWLQGRAQVEKGAPPPVVPTAVPSGLPSAGAAEANGPALPKASQLTRELQRFFRYDRNRDLKITRDEMLSTRVDDFRKLDKDGNNLLTFEEWAVATSDRFAGADANHDGWLSPAEFATTAPKRNPKPKCGCAK